jgi:octaprenyl-diphosphate synthase
MADDALDFSAPEEQLGKPVNNDLKEGKVTLPIIAALQRATPAEAGTISTYVQNADVSSADFQAIIEIVNKYNTLQSTLDQAQAHINQAKQQLNEFATSPALDTLYRLADYVTTRDV